MSTRETAQSLTALWTDRTHGLGIETVVARLEKAGRYSGSRFSRDNVDALLRCLDDPERIGTRLEAQLWADVITSWSYGHPAPSTFPVDLYPLRRLITRYCPMCGAAHEYPSGLPRTLECVHCGAVLPNS